MFLRRGVAIIVFMSMFHCKRRVYDVGLLVGVLVLLI